MSKRNPNRSRDNNIIVGVIVMIIGFGLLLRKMDFILFPHWLFSWEVLLIVIGVLVGVRKQFQGAGWLILILLGVFFLIDDLPGMDWIRSYSLPLGIIIVGAFLIFRSAITRSLSNKDENRYRHQTSDGKESGNADSSTGSSSEGGNSDDYIDTSTVFGSIKKKVFSKNFKGGQSTVLFGGSELDFTHADIDGVAVCDVMVAFGGLELVVPSNWDVKSEMTAILGGIEDKRSSASNINSNKQLILKGTCMFGGIEIKSY